MTDKMDSVKSTTPRREKPQTLDGIQATKSLNDTNCGSDPSIICSDALLIRNRSRPRNNIVAEVRSPRDHSSDGVMSTGAMGGSEFANEFENADSVLRRESLNYDDTSPNSQSSFAKTIMNRSMRMPCSSGTTTRKCVLTLDGYSYVIVASTPENIPKRDDSSCSSGGGNSNSTASGGGIGCSVQTGIATSSNQSDCSSSAQATAGTGSVSGGGAAGGGVGGINTHDFAKITSPSGVDGTSESVNFSITNNSIVSSLNGQVARHGALTIVRRSNSRKSFSQLETQHLHQHQHQVSTPTPSSTRGSFLSDDSLGKAPANSAPQHDNRLNESSANSTQQTYSLAQTPPTHNAQLQTKQHQQQQHQPPPLKMLPTSPNSSNTAPLLPTATDTQDDNMSESIMSMDESASALASAKASVDLATENLPAVDTPDACDKAALRLRHLLRMLNAGEISADVLQKNLHYAARVLEAVFIDESKSPTSGKAKMRQNSCSSVECEEEEPKNDKCNGDCKNVECQQHHHQSHDKHTTSLAAECDQTRSSDNNNTDQSLCSLRTNEESSNTPGSEDASSNQISIDSRTKGVCSAPQTHSGPTGPPGVGERGHNKDKDDDENKDTANATTTCSTSSSSTSNQNNSTVSSSSCSNKATIQRQKRLRTPVWARSMSTNKTYIN